MELNSLLIITFTLPAVLGVTCVSSYYNISERTPPSSVVYRVPSGYSLSSISDSNIAASFNRRFNTSQSGVVTVSSTIPLNRNAMAIELGRSILPVTYTLTYIDYSGLTWPPPCQTVMLYVTGQDNMVPNFTRSAVNFSILEGSGIPSSWPMDLAIDHDEGINSTQNYYIDNPIANAAFYLDITRDSFGAITILQLRRRVAIDREVTPSFNFTIVAEEGRPNAPKGYQRIYINVEDVCDSVPAFPITKYQTEAPENTSVNSVVLTVKAIDMDEGRNGLLSYSIASQCAKKTLGESCQSGSIYPADGSAPFALDSVSGNLVLIQKLDFDKAQEIDIVVLATDACNLVGTAQVQVSVLYVDDKPPTIQVILVSNGAIREDYSLSSDVATVTITSPVSFSVAVIDNITGSVSDTFDLLSFGSSYRLRLQRPLDSKVRNNYNVTIKATDTRNNVAYSTVSINVLAVNHPPVFDNKTAFVSIFDNTANGTVILRVHASDSDLGGNGMVTYELPPPNASYSYQSNFTVKTTDGDLLVNGILDRKVAKSFLLLIKARDNPTNGDPYFSDYMVVNITLLNPNGNRPIFSLQSAQININENIVTGTKIIQITSYNPEGVPNATVIAYSLALSSPVFQIDSVSGWIRVVSSLNNSATKRYVLNVTAYNGFPPPSTFILTIDILPGDAVGPVFVPRSYSALAMRTAAVGSHIVDVKAVDVYSTALQYEIIDGNGEGKFAINTANGTISVLKQLDQSSTQTYTLHVKASDPKFYSKWPAEVVIKLTNFAFVNEPYTFQVQERLLSGIAVGTVSTSLSYTGQVSFTILHSTPDDAFAMDSANGTITTKRALSAATGGYTLLIAATYYPSDQSTPPTSIQQVVTITVTQQIGNVQFQQSSYSTTISRSLEIGTALLNVTATDASRGIVTYALISSSPIPFQVDSNTGSIYLKTYLDSTPRCTYTFDIVASGYGSRSAVTVSVVVDLRITFDQSQYRITVPEKATKGSVVATIRASGRRGIPVYYYFSNDAPKKYFQIDKVSGDITLLVGITNPSTTVVRRQSSNPVVAMILAQDSQDPSINSTFSAALTLPTTILLQPQANPTSGTPLTIIVGGAGGGVLAVAVVIVAGLVAFMVRRKRRSSPKVTRAVVENCINSSSNRNSAVLTSFEAPNPPPHPRDVTVVVVPMPHTPQSQRSSSKDDVTKGEPVYRTSSLKTVPHTRSTSDLASTVGTEMLSGLEDAGPYTKAQLMAIYAANAQLLQDNVSQDSVHMFGSEGGVEVDEVDDMVLGKALQFEEEDELSVVGEDHSSIRQQGLQEQKERGFAGKRQWLASSTESDDMPPRYDMYSQSSSTYSQVYEEGRSSQTFHARPTHDQGYYNEMEQQWSTRYRLPANERSLSNIYTAPPLTHSAKKAMYSSVLEEGPISGHSHHLKYSQDLTSSDGPLPPNLNLHHNHTPLSDTQTDDGNLPNSSAHQGVGSGYYYASSSSIASTNLSQTVPRSQNMYNPSY